MVLLDKKYQQCADIRTSGEVSVLVINYGLHGHTRGPAGSQEGAGERGGAELSVGQCMYEGSMYLT